MWEGVPFFPEGCHQWQYTTVNTVDNEQQLTPPSIITLACPQPMHNSISSKHPQCSLLMCVSVCLFEWLLVKASKCGHVQTVRMGMSATSSSMARMDHHKRTWGQRLWNHCLGLLWGDTTTSTMIISSPRWHCVMICWRTRVTCRTFQRDHRGTPEVIKTTNSGMYMYHYTHIHTCTHTHTYTCTHMCTSTHTHVCTTTCTHTCTHPNTRTHNTINLLVDVMSIHTLLNVGNL